MVPENLASNFSGTTPFSSFARLNVSRMLKSGSLTAAL